MLESTALNGTEACVNKPQCVLTIYHTFIGTNALLCCKRYNWSLSELISNPEHIKYFSLKCWHFNGLSDIQKSTAGSLSDLIAIRDGQLCLPPLFFCSQQLGEIIDNLCTSWLYALFLSIVHFLSGLFTYYLCWIYVLDVRINIIIIREILWNRKHTKFQQSDVVSTRSDLTLSNATTEWINGLGQSLTWLRRASFTTEWRDTMVYYKRTPSPSLN